jgi:hypothetical protein
MVYTESRVRSTLGWTWAPSVDTKCTESKASCGTCPPPLGTARLRRLSPCSPLNIPPHFYPLGALRLGSVLGALALSVFPPPAPSLLSPFLPLPIIHAWSAYLAAAVLPLHAGLGWGRAHFCFAPFPGADTCGILPLIRHTALPFYSRRLRQQ